MPFRLSLYGYMCFGFCMFVYDYGEFLSTLKIRTNAHAIGGRPTQKDVSTDYATLKMRDREKASRIAAILESFR